MKSHRVSPRGTLSRDRIVGAALQLIDSDGIAALSARRLAARLNCQAMSLYNHIAGMDDLLDEIVDRLLGEALAATPPSGGIRAAALAYLALAERHPDPFILAATRVWRGPNGKAAGMAFVTHFLAIGCSDRESWRRARVLGAYLNGAGLALVAWQGSEGSDVRTGNGKRVRDDLEAGLDSLVAMLVRPANTLTE